MQGAQFKNGKLILKDISLPDSNTHVEVYFSNNELKFEKVQSTEKREEITTTNISDL